MTKFCFKIAIINNLEAILIYAFIIQQQNIANYSLFQSYEWRQANRQKGVNIIICFLTRKSKEKVKSMKGKERIDPFNSISLPALNSISINETVNQLYIRTLGELFHTLSMKTQNQKASERKQCPVCLKRVDNYSFLPFSNCGHMFCISCINQHIITKIREKKIVTCIEGTCKEVLLGDSGHIKVLSKQARDKYLQVILEYNNAQILKCRVAQCPGFVLMSTLREEGGRKVLTCSQCPNTFCAKCKNKVESCDCKENSYVYENLRNQYNYKRCPKCGYIIEKVKGCTHLTCICKYQFCQLCSLQWSNGHLCPTNNHNLSTNQLISPVPPNNPQNNQESKCNVSFICIICKCLQFLVSIIVYTVITVLLILESTFYILLIIGFFPFQIVIGITIGFGQWLKSDLRSWQIILLFLLFPITFTAAFCWSICACTAEGQQRRNQIKDFFPFGSIQLYRKYHKS